MSLTPKEEEALKYLASKARTSDKRISDLEGLAEQLQSIIKKGQDAPAYIDQIPGRRVPHLGTVEITIPAASTARLEGRFPVAQDGPFVILGIALFYERTAGPYANKYVAATTVNLEMAEAAMQLGSMLIYNNPIGVDFDLEISDTASDREWQNIAFPSALCNEEAGFMYLFPIAYLASTNTIIKVFATPKVQQDFAGRLKVMLLGYKIVTGADYQP